MRTSTIVLIVILVILVAALIALYFFGKKAEKKQAEQKEQMDAVAQTMNMLIIDKKRMKLKEAGLPAIVLEEHAEISSSYQGCCCKSESRSEDHDTDV